MGVDTMNSTLSSLYMTLLQPEVKKQEKKKPESVASDLQVPEIYATFGVNTKDKAKTAQTAHDLEAANQVEQLSSARNGINAVTLENQKARGFASLVITA